MKKLSIIIPVLNEAAIVEQQLSALRQQLCQAVEIIIVDGGSTDNTVSLAKPYADRLLTTHSRGRAAQMNTGAQCASAEILLFMHIDTVLPACVECLLQAVKPWQWGFFRVRLSGCRWPLRIIEYMMNLRSGISRVATGDQCLFMGKDLFEQQHGFAAIPLMEDVEISKRLRAYAKPMMIRQPVITSSRRWEECGIWRTTLLMWRLRWDYFCGVDPQALVTRYYADAKK
ncbi:MAG: TIGR04283 family arsenosugar biosynthesis glycosyltransferase [Cellvibrionaceae bacterium]|nr:TIGR04283 family arsenosugar biosynthesis glycosyltransferase [Cellvibrionaceae bacterium]